MSRTRRPRARSVATKAGRLITRMPKEVLYEFLKVLRRGYGCVTRQILSVGEATLRSLSRLAFSNHFYLSGLLCSVKIDKFKCPLHLPKNAITCRRNKKKCIYVLISPVSPAYYMYVAVHMVAHFF